MPVKRELGSEALLFTTIYGKLPTIGNRGGPGGNFLGFLVLLYSNKPKSNPIIHITYIFSERARIFPLTNGEVVGSLNFDI